MKAAIPSTEFEWNNAAAAVPLFYPHCKSHRHCLSAFLASAVLPKLTERCLTTGSGFLV